MSRTIKVPDVSTAVMIYVDEKPVARGCYKAYNENTVEINGMFADKIIEEKEFQKRFE